MDKQKFISFVKANREALRRYLVGLCGGDSDLADDIAQETYIKAYIGSDSFRDESKFTAWIFKIAFNEFLNSKRTIKPITPLEEARNLSDGSASDSLLYYQDLYDALNSLSVIERNVILLFYIQGYSSKEIAGIMEMSDFNIRQILSRARKSLKNKLI